MEINDVSLGMYDSNSHIELKTTMLKPNLCDYSDAYILKELYQLKTRHRRCTCK